MIFRLTIAADNAAFYNASGEYAPEWELARLLREIADRVEREDIGHYRTIFDSNGLDVGRFGGRA